MANQEAHAQRSERRRFDFAPDLPETPAIVANGRPRRTGIIALCIGASKIVRGKDGAKYQFTALDLKKEKARAAADGRELTIGCICFECRRVYDTFEDMDADHRDTDADMQQADVRHTWAYWCEDKLDAKSSESLDTLRGEAKALQNALKASQESILKKTEIDDIMKERERADKLKTMLDTARAKIRDEERRIIGLLSETKFGA